MISIPADSDTAKLAHRISELCKTHGLQIRKSRKTLSNNGVRCEFVLAMALIESASPRVESTIIETPAFINTAMRDAGEKVILDRWDCDAYMKATAGEVVEQIYVMMHAKRPVEEIEVTPAMRQAGGDVLNADSAPLRHDTAYGLAKAVFKAMIAARTS